MARDGAGEIMFFKDVKAHFIAGRFSTLKVARFHPIYKDDGVILHRSPPPGGNPGDHTLIQD
jgi:hypothetical protein